MPEQPQPNSSSIRQPSRVCEPRAAVLLRDLGVHQADLVGLLDDLLRQGGVPVVLPRDRADLLLGEVVRQLAQVFLLVGEREVNHVKVSLSESGERVGGGLLGQTTDWRVNIVPDGPGPEPGIPLALPNLAGVEFGTVIWIIVLVVAPIAAVLFAGAFGLLEQLGRGGLALDERPPRPAPAPTAPAAEPSGRRRSASWSRPATTARSPAASRRSTSRPRWTG